MSFSIHDNFSSICPYVGINIYNKLPPNYNPLMLPFKNDFLCVYYWGLLTHFSLLDSSILKWNIENHEVVNSENYLPFYMPK